MKTTVSHHDRRLPRFSTRMLLKNPGLTLTILLTLALGVGADTAIFTVDYATLLERLPYPHPEQLMVGVVEDPEFHNGISAGDYADWKRENTAFQDLNAWTGGAFNLSTKDDPEQIDGRMVTPGFYHMLGTPFFMGRDFLPEEGQTGRNHEVVLTHKLWKRLSSNPHIVGETLRVNAEPYIVVGLLAPRLYDGGQGDIAVPLAFKPEQLNDDFHWLLTIGRLKPGVTMEQARADMNAVTMHIAQQYPKSNEGWGAYVEPLKNDFIPEERIRTLWMLLGAVAFVLLITCVNVANLLLARSMARQKEMAVRSSLGATPRTIFTQLLTESILLALIGGALGVGVGYAMLHALMAAMPEGTLPSEADLSLTSRCCYSPWARQRWLGCSSAACRLGTRREWILRRR
jgi:predicted permease